MTGDILRGEGLYKSFNGTVATDNVDLSIEEGEIHGIIGPNGSGKTTLFNLFSGFLEPDAGRIYFDGTDVTDLSPDALARRGLARTFQITTPFERMTTRENLLSTFHGGVLSGFRIPSEHRERATKLLNVLDLQSVADETAGGLSGGQQKLLELGRVLMLDPDCVLLDEPTAGVNPALQERLLASLRHLNQDGTTVVLVEHDMHVIEGMCDRLTVLNRGRIISEGSFAEVTADISVEDAYLGSASTSSPADRSSPTGRQSAMAAPPIEAGSVGETRVRHDAKRCRDHDTFGDQKTDDTGSMVVEPDRPRLVAKDVVTGYGKHTVVDGVSVRSREGVTCIFGPNGSGKTTVLKALAGILPVWSGRIEYDARPMNGREPHEFLSAGISMVPQQDMIFPALTVRENLLVVGSTATTERGTDERIEEVLETFPPLADNLSSRAGDLSGGQQRMLGFGRAMMTDGDIYLLDEPTSSLAPGVRADIFEHIEELARSDAQIILVEQNVREALSIADHVYLLAGGTIQFDGSPAALRDESKLLERFLGIE